MNKISISFSLEEWEVIVASLKTRRDALDAYGLPKEIRSPEEPIILTIEENIKQ